MALLLGLVAQVLQGATTISTSPTADTNWTLAGSPYTLTTTITVPAGVTLTIDPGVQVLAFASAGLDIDGTLVAVGTAGAPITFTRAAVSGLWSGLSVTGTAAVPGTASLSYVNVSFGGSCTFCADLYIENGATTTVANSTFTDSGGNGIYAHTGSVNVSDTTFTNNLLAAIRYDSATSNPVLARLTATGNGSNAVSVGGGTMSGTYTWEATGLPYIITSSQSLAAGGSLTIAPGVTARFGSGVRVTINGVLTATATPVSPITLAGTTSSPGFWDGLQIVNGSASLDSVTISDAGACALCGNLYVDTATVQVKRSSFTNGAKDGIDVHAGTVNVADSSFTSNGRYAINYETATIDPVLSNLSATGNATNAVAIGPGTMTGASLWEATGVPYVVTGAITVAAGSSLQIDPGTQVLFATPSSLTVKGLLRASGSATLPISMTGQAGTPGAWEGIYVTNTPGATPATATLDYVTLAGGGGGCTNCADLFIDNGRVQVTHSTIRDSAKDGVWQHTGSGSSIETTQIIANAGYGVNNDQTRTTYAVQATNNWWGSVSGPTSPCVSGGSGSSVRGSVAVVPFLAAANADPGPVAAGDLEILTVTPLRWFAPADNTTRLFVKLTLRSGLGVPISGRVLSLSSTPIGIVTAGGTTDVNGTTFAYVVSSSPGDAVLTATTSPETACVFARSQPSTVTFTAASNNPLRPDIEAPYLDGGIKIDPEPVTQGVLTTISATLSNKNSVPISVDATLGYAQSGIGLTFGPIGQVLGTIIPANSDKTIQVQWTPAVSGKYCIQLQYNAVAAASSPVSISSVRTSGFGSGSSQRNLNAAPGSLGSRGDKDTLNKANKAFKVVSKIPSGQGTQIPKAAVGHWWSWMFNTASDSSKALGGDPPSLSYKTIVLADAPPVLPATTFDSGVSAARIAALNAVNDALLDFFVQSKAVLVSMDRAGGAAQAGNLLWNSQQTAAILEYKKRLGNAVNTLADNETAFLQVLTNEGVTTIPVTLADVQAYQSTLSTQGFSADDITVAHLLGYSDADIEARRQDLINSDPTTMTGDMFVVLTNQIPMLRALGNALINPTNFPPPTITVSNAGRASTLATIPNPNHLARVYPVTTSVMVGNPTASQATIDLRPRVVDLPSDWTVLLTPASVTLNPGDQTAVNVTITPGAPVPQGITPRVAVEGYIGTNLLGGVAVDVMVPTAVPFRMSIGGDANGDGSVTVSDIFYLINNLFAGGPAPVVGDANGDGQTTAGDIFYLINYLFAGGAAPL